MKKQRERLIELMNQAETRCANTERCVDCEYNGVDGCMAYNIVDYLLAEGVIVPPVKVGDTVYRIVGANSLTPYIYDWQITEIRIYQDELLCIDDSDNPIFVDEIGKTVFLTKEEAEKALAEREGKG